MDTGIFHSGKTAKGCIHGPLFRRVPLAGFELAVSRHVRFTMWRTRNLVAPEAAIIMLAGVKVKVNKTLQ